MAAANTFGSLKPDYKESYAGEKKKKEQYKKIKKMLSKNKESC